MSWYNEYNEQWKETIETVALEEHRITQMVEKDTIQSKILFELSKSNLPLVFKGGTSLSKVYGLIDRFSEDIDLSTSRKASESEKRKINATILATSNAMGLTLINPEEIQSRHSYNKYIFEYESLFSENPLELVIETNFFLTSYPAEVHTVNSFVGMFCKNRKINLPIPFEEAHFEMQVQSMERTFIDKVFAICDYKLQNRQENHSRHLYDIAKLFSAVEISPELVNLIGNVRKDRMLSKNNPSAQPEYNIPNMLREIIDNHFYESDYNSVTTKLLYEDISYDNAIKNGISLIADSDIFE